MNILIIGNGAAANQAAESIRKYNRACGITMFAKEIYPEYSACALPDILAGWCTLEKTFLKTYADYEHMQIQTCFGMEVQHIDVKNRSLTAADEVYPYDKLIIAAGSRPVIPAVNGSDLNGNFVVKTINDIEKIIAYQPSRAAVVGAGNIGVETASALKNRGCEVYLLEMQDRVMPLLFDKKPADMIQDMLEKEGINVFTGEKVTGIEGVNRVEGLFTDKRDIRCDTIIWAAGVRQNVELARNAGLKIGSLGGIEVNRHMQCSEPGFFACGDCVQSFHIFTGNPSLSLLWSSAKIQAEVAAANSLGYSSEYQGNCSVVIEEVAGVPCVSMGLTLKDLDSYDVKVIEKAGHDFYYRLLIVDDRIAGFQSIGRCEGAGALFTMIKKKTALREVREALQCQKLIPNLAWYIDVGEYIMDI